MASITFKANNLVRKALFEEGEMDGIKSQVESDFGTKDFDFDVRQDKKGITIDLNFNDPDITDTDEEIRAYLGDCVRNVEKNAEYDARKANLERPVKAPRSRVDMSRIDGLNDALKSAEINGLESDIMACDGSVKTFEMRMKMEGVENDLEARRTACTKMVEMTSLLEKAAARSTNMPENTPLYKVTDVGARYAGNNTTEVKLNCAGFTGKDGVPIIGNLMQAVSAQLKSNGYAGDIVSVGNVLESTTNTYGLGNAAKSIVSAGKKLEKAGFEPKDLSVSMDMSKIPDPVPAKTKEETKEVPNEAAELDESLVGAENPEAQAEDGMEM